MKKATQWVDPCFLIAAAATFKFATANGILWRTART
jgi:hypothetical protein